GTNRQGGPAHRGHERAGGWPVRGHVTLDLRLIAVVSGGEVDADPLDDALQDRVLLRLDVPGRQQLGVKAIRVADYRRDVLVHDVVERRVQVLEVVRCPDEHDVRRG